MPESGHRQVRESRRVRRLEQLQKAISYNVISK